MGHGVGVTWLQGNGNGLVLKVLALRPHATSPSFIGDFWTPLACSKLYFEGSYFARVLSNASPFYFCLGSHAVTSISFKEPSGCLATWRVKR